MNNEEITRDMPECEKWNMADVQETGKELTMAIDDLHEINRLENDRQAKYAFRTDEEAYTEEHFAKDEQIDNDTRDAKLGAI